MIGKAAFTRPDGTRVAVVLTDDCDWQVSPSAFDGREGLVGLMDALKNLHNEPADGTYGHWHLNYLADTFGGTVEFEPKRPHPEGTVY